MEKRSGDDRPDVARVLNPRDAGAQRERFVATTGEHQQPRVHRHHEWALLRELHGLARFPAAEQSVDEREIRVGERVVRIALQRAKAIVDCGGPIHAQIDLELRALDAEPDVRLGDAEVRARVERIAPQRLLEEIEPAVHRRSGALLHRFASAQVELVRRALGRVAASLRRSGRKTTARSYDAMIAATAIASGLPIYTCNPGDFSEIDGLEVVAVPVPGAR